MIHMLLLISRHGKIRLKRTYNTTWRHAEKQRLAHDAVNMTLSRKAREGNILEWKGYKLIYKRYASLLFAMYVDANDNELIHLQHIHRFVECLDNYFGNVCELDIVYNFQQAYSVCDELFLGGEIQESGRSHVTALVHKLDAELESDMMKHYLQATGLNDYGL